MISESAIDLLNKIEKSEMRSLGWGFVDGVIKEKEILSLFEYKINYDEIDNLTADTSAHRRAKWPDQARYLA